MARRKHPCLLGRATHQLAWVVQFVECGFWGFGRRRQENFSASIASEPRCQSYHGAGLSCPMFAMVATATTAYYPFMQQEDFDVASLAAYLHLDPQQIERLANRGKIPARKVGGKWRFSPAEVHHWMEQRLGLLDDDQLAQVEGAMSPRDTEATEDLSVRRAVAVGDPSPCRWRPRPATR